MDDPIEILSALQEILSELRHIASELPSTAELERKLDTVVKELREVQSVLRKQGT